MLQPLLQEWKQVKAGEEDSSSDSGATDQLISCLCAAES